MTEYGRIHTDGSRSGGQPLIANRKAHTMLLEVLAEWGIAVRNATAQQLAVATTEALCRAIDQQEDLRQPTQSDALAKCLAALDDEEVVHAIDCNKVEQRATWNDALRMCRQRITAALRQPTQSDALQADALDFGNELIFACAGLRHEPINTEAIFSITWDGFPYDVTIRAAQGQSK